MTGDVDRAVSGTVARVAPDDDAYDVVMAVASGQIDLAEIARTLARWH